MYNNKILDRFWKKVKIDPITKCWEWIGAKDTCGYGMVRIHYTGIRTHRFLYMVLIGKIPPNMQLDHLCENKSCCNPKHLDVVSQKENMIRATSHISNINRRKTHCPKGHPYSGNNLRIYKNMRYCIECGRYKNRIKKKLFS